MTASRGCASEARSPCSLARYSVPCCHAFRRSGLRYSGGGGARCGRQWAAGLCNAVTSNKTAACFAPVQEELLSAGKAPCRGSGEANEERGAVAYAKLPSLAHSPKIALYCKRFIVIAVNLFNAFMRRLHRRRNINRQTPWLITE